MENDDNSRRSHGARDVAHGDGVRATRGSYYVRGRGHCLLGRATSPVAPGEPLEAVCDSNTLLVATVPDGTALRLGSAAYIQVLMPDQVEIEPGWVLKIGSGRCNAALITELVGAEGSVAPVGADAVVVPVLHHSAGATSPWQPCMRKGHSAP